jgi:ATP/maltotriose-dependent transcriptional regulator MalT
MRTPPRAGIGQLTYAAGPHNAEMGIEDHLAAGHRALASGQWDRARAAFEAALALDRWPEALGGLGSAWWWLGEPVRSNELRQQAYALFRRAGDAQNAVTAALDIAVTYKSNFGNGPAANGWVARAERLLTGDDDPLAPWVWCIRAYVTPDLTAAITLYERAIDAARANGDIDLELCSLSGLGEKLVMSGDVEAGLALVDEAMAGTLGGEYARLDTVVYACCDMLVACDLANDLERAARWCQVADRFIRDYGCPFLSARCRTIYGGLLVTTGRWAEGERELRAAIAMSEGAGTAVAADAHARMADLRLRQGRVEEASALLRGFEDQARAQLAAAALRLASGDPAGAVTLLRRNLAGTAAGHAASAPSLALLVRASLVRDEVEDARRAADHLTRLADDRPAAYTKALAAAAEAQLFIVSGHLEPGTDRLETALRLFTGLDMPYEAAQARLELARLHAGRQPDTAVAEAHAALATFDRIGAATDADAAAALLRSLGAPPRPSRRATGELTDRERQVLHLVVMGLSNPEIAARLHISRKTAAHHVSNVLTKLGARNRTEAAARASATGPG